MGLVILLVFPFMLMAEILKMQDEFISRISHTEPGNVKGFYKKLNEDLNKEIKVVADELAKATKA